MEIDPASTFINTLYHQQSEAMELSFDEQNAATLGEDFSHPVSAESNNTSTQCDFVSNNIIEHFTSPSQFFNNSIKQNVIINDDDDDDNNDNDNENDNNTDNNIVSSNFNVEELQQLHGKEETKKKQTKRKRQPSQVQDHIIAERKRRELLSQMFISLSAIVPGLKKVDKTSVLGEAIKYMKQLQEKVKVLEEDATKRTIVVVKNSHLKNNDVRDSSSTTVDDSYASGSGDSNSNNNGESNNYAINYNDSLPEVEAKVSGKTLLLRVSCEDQKGILAKLFAELDKHDISVTNCSVIPFDSLVLDINIVAQIKERGFIDNVRGFIRSLRSALRLIN